MHAKNYTDVFTWHHSMDFVKVADDCVVKKCGIVPASAECGGLFAAKHLIVHKLQRETLHNV